MVQFFLTHLHVGMAFDQVFDCDRGEVEILNSSHYSVGKLALFSPCTVHAPLESQWRSTVHA